MNPLHIYPTSRALRKINSIHKAQEGFLPTLMRMDEFEQRAILLDNKKQIDPLKRILLLRKAAKFKSFEALKLDISLVRFFTKSDAIFKFFEELAVENVSFNDLAEADAYVEFATHLEILKNLLANYQTLLDAEGYTDKVFIPSHYILNMGFLKSYTQIEIHLEGYLSHFELNLLYEIAQHIPLHIYYTTSPFNRKMQERFSDIGIPLPNHKHLIFSLSDKVIIKTEDNNAQITPQIYAVEQREEQIAIAFKHIDEMVHSGIEAEEIVLILPDESIKEHFTLFDSYHNLNFAMGYDYSKGRIYKSLEALYGYWQRHDKESKILLERYGFSMETIDSISTSKKLKVESFFEIIHTLGLHDSPLVNTQKVDTQKKEKYTERVYEKYLYFMKILEAEVLIPKEWLFLWLKSLSQITLDDVRGGKITVMGVLETRGVGFKGVVIVDFNEGIVPASSSKDQFLNSSVRAFANLPTKHDREALQKQYYKSVLERAECSVIIYSTSDNKLPSKFLYELGLQSGTKVTAQFDLLYAQPSQSIKEETPMVKDFDAKTIVWSASRLKTYLECKRKYYYRYIQKIQAKKEDELNEGAFLHLLLDHLFREKMYYTSTQEMQQGIDMLLDTLLPYENAKVAYQKLLWKSKLKDFVASQIAHFNASWKVIEHEKEFQSEIGGLRFKGRIDRIDQNDTHTLVLDYKSGSTKDAQKTKNLETLTDLQMSIYFHLLSPKYQNIKLAFIKLFEEGTIEEIKLLEEKNKRLSDVIIELKQTKSFEANKTDVLQHCKFCEFTLLCERGNYL